MDAVYTDAAEHGFAQYLYLSSNGFFTGTIFQAIADTLATAFQRLEVGELAPQDAIGRAGAGGLGLGASIDFEVIDPVNLDNPTAPAIGPADPTQPTIGPAKGAPQPTLEEREAQFRAYWDVER